MIVSGHSDKLLNGVRVLDLTLNLPGPYTSRLLADLGAQVTKVESPRGDPAKVLPEFYKQLNHGKNKITLDLKNSEDLEKLKTLVKESDVFLEGFRPGVAKKLGVDFEAVKALNSQIIYCSISGFGQTGPLRNVPAHDLNLQGISGYSNISNSKKVFESPLPIADFTAASSAVSGILAGLYKNKSSEPTAVYVDIAMSEPLAHMVDTWGKTYIDSDKFSQTIGNVLKKKAEKSAVLRFVRVVFNEKRIKVVAKLLEKVNLLDLLPHYGIYKTQDSYIVLGIVDEDHFWKSFCESCGGLLLRFKKMKLVSRVLFAPIIRPIVKFKLKRKTTHEWIHLLGNEQNLPVSEVNNRKLIFDDPQFAARGKVYILEGMRALHSPFTNEPSN